MIAIINYYCHNMEMSLFFNINVNDITKNEHQPQTVIILQFMVFIIVVV